MIFANPIHKLNIFFFLIIATELLCFKCPKGGGEGGKKA